MHDLVIVHHRYELKMARHCSDCSPTRSSTTTTGAEKELLLIRVCLRLLPRFLQAIYGY
jgi:hypothetical protein